MTFAWSPDTVTLDHVQAALTLSTALAWVQFLCVLVVCACWWFDHKALRRRIRLLDRLVRVQQARREFELSSAAMAKINPASTANMPGNGKGRTWHSD